MEKASNQTLSESSEAQVQPMLSIPPPTISIEYETEVETTFPSDIENVFADLPSPRLELCQTNPQCRSLSIPTTRQERRQSLFREMIQTSVSEGTRLNDEKAVELEGRLKSLVSAFSRRTSKTKEEIKRPPTPSSEESESDTSTAVSENNLLHRLEAFLPTPYTSRRPSLQLVDEHQNVSKSWRSSLGKHRNFFKLKYLLDPQSGKYIFWLGIVSVVFLYNAWLIPFREIFDYQDESNVQIWFWMDCLADTIYLLDILFWKSHVRFVQDGFPIQTVTESWKVYVHTTDFILDLLSLLPLDIISSLTYRNLPLLRLPRLFKITTFWELFARLDTSLASPFLARISKTIIYMLYMIHLNAVAYYALSDWEGQGSTEWTYGYGTSGDGNAYIRCFYFATKTATSIGKNPRPSNEIEYLFMTFAWLSGVFLFALLLAQIRDIIAHATKAQTDYRQVCDATFNYLHSLNVPSHLKFRVKSWLSYTWAEQKTLDEGMVIAQLPEKIQADLALHVHITTLSKVKLFKNCETAFLRDLVVKLRSIIFLPGDYVCRKGEVGKEMYIIRTGRVNVLGGDSGHAILATLSSGSVFGEIALLAIGGMTKRTADVRAAGFANLFVLSKTDLNQAIKDYPEAQASLRKKAKKIIRENAKKRKAEAEAEDRKKKASDSMEISHEKVIIKNKAPQQPRLLDTVLKALGPGSMTSKYLKYGSKANSMEVPGDETIFPSYPPSPYLSASAIRFPSRPTESYSSNSSEDDIPFFLSSTSVIPAPNRSEEDNDEVFLNDQDQTLSKNQSSDISDNSQTMSMVSVVKRHQQSFDTLASTFSDDFSSTSDQTRVPSLQRQFSLEIESDDSM